MNEPLSSAVGHWKTFFGRRDDIAAAVLPQVSTWEWSTGSRHGLLPYRFERYPGRGRRLKARPPDIAQHTESGLAAEGRLLVERVYDYRHEPHETLILHGEAMTEVVTFAPEPRLPLGSARIVRADGRVVRHVAFRLNGYTPKFAEVGRSPDRLVEWLGPNGRFLTAEDYHWDGEVLREVEVYLEMPGIGPARSRDRFSYADDGSLAGIDRVWADESVQAVYRPRRRGQTLDALRVEAIAELVPAIVDAVRHAAIAERAYCLELGYRAVSQHYPPLITVGLDDHRAGLRRDQDLDLAYRPVLLGGRGVELRDPDRLKSCRLYDQEVRAAERWEEGRRMLREAAAELTKKDWRGILEVTHDFLAFAIDPEMDDLETALAASVGQQQIAAWKARGWL